MGSEHHTFHVWYSRDPNKYVYFKSHTVIKISFKKYNKR